jgi:hypothetical protein
MPVDPMLAGPTPADPMPAGPGPATDTPAMGERASQVRTARPAVSDTAQTPAPTMTATSIADLLSITGRLPS